MTVYQTTENEAEKGMGKCVSSTFTFHPIKRKKEIARKRYEALKAKKPAAEGGISELSVLWASSG